MLATHISHYGGAALLIDYGPARSAFGDSFQAMQRIEKLIRDNQAGERR